MRWPHVGIPTMGDFSIGGTNQRLQNSVFPSRTNTRAQPATIMPKEFAIKAHFFVSP